MTEGASADTLSPGASVARKQRSAPRTRQPKRLELRDPRLPVADLFSVEKARVLWESLDPEFRQDHFDKENMPPLYERNFPERPGYQWYSKSISLREIPEPMTWELAWFLHKEVTEGKLVQPGRFRTMRFGFTLATQHGSTRARKAESITALSPEEWEREVLGGAMRANHDGGRAAATSVRELGKRIQDRLAFAYHEGDWWQLNVWNPVLDPRVPQREHEPSASSSANFSHLTTDWLREAAKWWLATQLMTERYVWTSVKSRLDHFKWLQWYIDEVGASGPTLVDDLADLRGFIRGYVSSLNNHKVMVGANKGKQLGINGRRQPMITVETFYRWMYDNRKEAAHVLNEPRWLELQPQHTSLFLPGDKPRGANRMAADLVLEDDVVTAIAAKSGLLAAPKAEGGFDDEQALRILMLLLRTGRRMNEILMLEYDPLVPLTGGGLADPDTDGFIARLQYTRTKIISSDPAVIPVDQEVVDIIRAQQVFASEYIRSRGAAPDATPKYLFLGTTQNRLGNKNYPAATFSLKLGELTKRLNLMDSLGRPVTISKTHQFRHTRATTLINAGVPIHVVMRYLGHVTPAMTMHYAKTLAETTEREFLRYKKVTADGRQIDFDGSDLFDLVHLEQRADRILPNGWCLLPPRQTCGKGNACLTCDKFVTDESHRSELERQRDETMALIDRRQTQFSARFGEEMGPDNVWLAGRTSELTALDNVLVSLDQISVREGGTVRAIRGAGALTGTDQTSGNEASA